MFQVVPANQKSFMLVLDLITKSPEQLRVYTYDIRKPYTLYSDRYININGSRQVEIRLPLTPNELGVVVYNVRTRIHPKQKDNTYNAELVSSDRNDKRKIYHKLKTWQVWTDADTDSFIKFAQSFCVNAGVIPIGMYQSNDRKFTIDFLNVIKDKSGNIMFTPSQIGNKTGLIRVSREHFLKYSIPMRYVILLHEYSHKYINPKKGKKITDEFAADKNALYIFLGQGFPRVDARTVYLKVFITSDSEENLRRYNAIDDFIKQFDAGKITSEMKF
jgi:hypothetical protein